MLVRYRFPGRRIVDAMVDLPFALPTAVAGIALTALYAPERLDRRSSLTPLGIKIAYTPLGIVIALIFIGLPFVVRTVQPVMEEIDREVEEAAATLGANRFQTSPACSCRAWRRRSSPASRSPSRAPSANTARSSSSPAICRSSLGDRAAADRHQARGIQLCRRDRDRRDHAGDLVRHAASSSI